MHQMTSSWREVSLAETSGRAEQLLSTFSIVRVTEITWLDRIGIPVYASVRPTALEGSLCVNAGKGSTRDEARIGAIMEAIEFAFAEKNYSGYEIFESSPAAIANQRAFRSSFVDFCPVLGVREEPGEP